MTKGSELASTKVNQPHFTMPELDGDSVQMCALRAEITRVAACGNSTVLIAGESGTGKELVARAVHRLSTRAGKSFVPFNCTAVPSELIESMLFGHRRGSFSGAHADQTGVIRAAGGGTLFLDEIGELPLDLQPKLLRFLQNREVHPVGDALPQRVDVRVIAATNKDLVREVRGGRFRQDLFYRLNVLGIQTPTLAERAADIPSLIHHTLGQLRTKMDRMDEIRIEMSAVQLFERHRWPGNVRELENALERAAARVSEGGLITEEIARETLKHSEILNTSGEDDLRLAVMLPAPIYGLPRHESPRRFANRIIASLIETAIKEAGGNKAAAARSLGINRETLCQMQRRARNSSERSF